MVPFTPRLIPAILPNLAHHVAMIQSAAIRTNKLLLNVIQKLPSPQEPPPKPSADKGVLSSKVSSSPTPTSSSTNTTNSRQSTLNSQISRDVSSPDPVPESAVPSQRNRTSIADPSLTPRPAPPAEIQPNPGSRPHSPVSTTNQGTVNGSQVIPPLQEEVDPFDYQSTVNELTIQFLSEFEETRVAALKWLIMLHQKAPKKVYHSFTFLKANPPLMTFGQDPCDGRWDISSIIEDSIR